MGSLLDEGDGDHDCGAPPFRRIELRRSGARLHTRHARWRQRARRHCRHVPNFTPGADFDREAYAALCVRVLVEALLVTISETGAHALNHRRRIADLASPLALDRHVRISTRPLD